MRRREFITMVGGVAAAWPLAVRAQEAGRTYRLGVVTISPRTAPYFVAMFDELQRVGFIEGQNLTIDWRSYGPRVDLIPKVVAELVNAKVDIIYVSWEPGIRAAQQATSTIPIIGAAEDMVGSGLVNSLAHPGGNTTGLSFLAAELNGKRQEILIEAVPGLRRMAALADPNQTTPKRLQALKDAARKRSVELLTYQVTTAEEIPAAIDAMKASGAEALNVLPSTILYGNRQIIFQRATEMRLPAIYQSPEEAEEGGFIAYGARLVQMFRELLAPQLIKLLRGAKPADIPVEQPTKFELVINLKTAKALQLTIPESFLVRADEVIE
jgi:putative tryptophan/tyrosine transport system substrate-binding protein